MRRRFLALFCLLGAAVLVAGACTPPGGPGNTAPTAVIDASPTSGAPPLEVTFSATGSTDVGGSIASYLWDLGDGDTSGLENLTHTYTAAGIYTVTLTVTDNLGKTDTETVDITVGDPNQSPTVTAAADVTSGLAPLTVNFTSSASDLDGTVASIEWDFDDGDTSTDADPTHTYSTPGTYVATVTVTDDVGAVTSDSVTIEVTANQAPTAVATSDVTSGKAPLTVNFDGSGSTDPDNNIASYDWDFGGGNTAAGPTAAHTFNADGSYPVTLTVTDDLGASDTTTLTILVQQNAAPIANIQATPTSGNAPLEVNFDGTTSADSDGTVVSWDWDFGDSQTDAGSTVSHTYASAGTYIATLTVTDDNGDTGTDIVTINVSVPNVAPTAVAGADVTSGPEDLVVNFNSSNSSDPDGSIATTVWNFGDGDTDVAAAPQHTFTDPGTYTVTLTVTDDDGSSDTDSLTITVTPNQLPVAAATAVPLTGKVGANFAFDGTASSDPDGSVVDHDWDFGDGGTASGANPNHSYSATGTYTATLTVTDDDGGTDTDTVTITVNANQAPSAAISANPQTGAYPLVVSFDSAASADPDGSIASVAWNFGDGGTSSDAAPDHTYTSAGTFTATLTVTDDNGATDTASVTITVVQDNDGDGFSPPTDCDDTEAGTYPGAPDPLDEDGVDSNCDGADGTAADTVFVDSAGGSDSGSCGPLGSPCATIGQGVANANGTGKGVVQVSSGSYAGFTLNGDLVIRGGYESDFDGRAGTTTVTGNGTGVLASGATPGATLADLSIDSGTPAGAGASAYGVRAVSGGTISIENSDITAQAGNSGADAADQTGNAPSGTNGANGTGGASHGSSTGGSGGNAVAPGGTGGNNPGRENGNAGGNGTGGACGGAGGDKGFYGGSKGHAGCGGAAGAPGATGSGGTASTAGFAAMFDASAGDSANGGAGINGGGGGGGGAGGAGCDGWACVGNWLSGGAGGGGGGGGAGGIGGSGGNGGGGSFAIYSVNTTVNIDSNTTLATADGGSGGDGGNGQQGGSGGASGTGGAGNCTGGCVNGGPSVAMLNVGTGSITFGGDLSTQVNVGSGGSGGVGGDNGSAGQSVKMYNAP